MRCLTQLWGAGVLTSSIASATSMASSTGSPNPITPVGPKDGPTWTNGQAERMNCTVKEATIKSFHYPDLDSLKAHVLAFVSAYNLAKHLKALRWRTPFEAVCRAWTTTPDVFKLNPRHLIPGPNT